MTASPQTPDKSEEFRLRQATILDSAEQLFLERGEDRVTVEMIADRADIGKGTVYKHFKTKDEICLTLMLRFERQLSELFAEKWRLLAQSNQEAGATVLEATFRTRLDDPDRYAMYERLEHRLSTRNTAPELLKELYTLRQQKFDAIEKVLQHRISEGWLADEPTRFHMFAIWTMLSGMTRLRELSFFREQIQDEAAFQEYMIRGALRFLRPEGGGGHPDQDPDLDKGE